MEHFTQRWVQRTEMIPEEEEDAIKKWCKKLRYYDIIKILNILIKIIN